MPPGLTGCGFLFAAYLCGSVPFGYLAGKLVRGIDLRQHGSGNIGATNAGRVLGHRWGALVLLLDLLKGLVPVFCLGWLAEALPLPGAAHWRVGCGVAAIIGHMYPCWLGFRGGKGVATALGVAICLGPWASLAAAATFATAFAITRIVSLGSIVAALMFALVQLVLLWPHPFGSASWSLAAFSTAVPALILVRHRANLVRLIRGVEPRYGHTSAPPPASVSPPRAPVESESQPSRADQHTTV